MAIIEVKIPQMGEGVVEATIIKWHVKTGDKVNSDDILCDIATDKVDSEIVAPESGVVKEILFKEGDIVPVGKTIVRIENSSLTSETYTTSSEMPEFKTFATVAENKPQQQLSDKEQKSPSTVYLSPLVKQIIQQHQLQPSDIEKIKGTGYDGRITKDDVLLYISQNNKTSAEQPKPANQSSFTYLTDGETIIEMDRVRKLIAEHMVRSKHTSAHVSSFIDVDVTRIVNWRNKVKDEFQVKYGIKLTYLPLFIQVLAKALLKFPMLNASVEGEKIILKKNINIGIATALPNNNLIVPVLKNADQLNVLGIAKAINDLAARARDNKLLPSEIMGGTFSVTNLGTFGTLAGTPIINQPQVAIIAIGTVQKVPAVVETPEGDMIAIRHKTILSLSYDHRIIDGMLAGKFLKYYKDELENIDIEKL